MVLSGKVTADRILYCGYGCSVKMVSKDTVRICASYNVRSAIHQGNLRLFQLFTSTNC